MHGGIQRLTSELASSLPPTSAVPRTSAGRRARHGLRRLVGHAAFELQVQDLLVVGVPHDVDHDLVLALELAAEQFLGERILDAVLDRPAQRPGAEVEVLAALP